MYYSTGFGACFGIILTSFSTTITYYLTSLTYRDNADFSDSLFQSYSVSIGQTFLCGQFFKLDDLEGVSESLRNYV